MRCLALACTSADAATDQSTEQNIGATDEKVHHYMYVGQSDEQLDDQIFSKQLSSTVRRWRTSGGASSPAKANMILFKLRRT